MPNEIAITDQVIKQNLSTWAPDLLYFMPDKPRLKAFIQSAALCIFENADLREAIGTQNGKLSLFRALERGAASGLSLNPQEGKAALVCIQGKVEWWPMKNGLIELAHESGKVEYIAAETVYAKDAFRLTKTAHGDDYTFEPALKDRGDPVLYFAVLALVGGRSVVKMMTLEQVQVHMKKYGKGIDRPKSAWVANFNGMAEKTVLKAVLHSTYLGKAVQDALEADDLNEQPPERNVTGTAEKGTGADDLAGKLASPTASGNPPVDAPAAQAGEETIKRDPETGDELDIF